MTTKRHVVKISVRGTQQPAKNMKNNVNKWQVMVGKGFLATSIDSKSEPDTSNSEAKQSKDGPWDGNDYGDNDEKVGTGHGKELSLTLSAVKEVPKPASKPLVKILGFATIICNYHL
jgi:hypothetical protein